MDTVNEINPFTSALRLCKYLDKRNPDWDKPFAVPLANSDAEITSVSKINAAKELKILTSFRKGIDDSVFDEMELQNILNLPSGKIRRTAVITNNRPNQKRR
ncbi:MAG: hypothetical protein ACRCZY_03080 [Phocaeicola sp.]